MFSNEYSTSGSNLAVTLAMVWRALRKRWLPALGVTSAVFVVVALYTASIVPVYYSEMSILIDNKTSLPIAPEGAPAAEQTTNLATEIEILKSAPLIAQAIAELPAPFNQIDPGTVTGSLTFNKLGQADILVVGYRDTNPQRIPVILNALGQTYVRYSLENKRSQASNAIKFVEERLPRAQRQLMESAIALKKFRERNKIVDPDSYATNITGALQTMRQEEQTLKISLDQTRRRYEDLRRQVGQDPDTALATTVLSQDRDYLDLTTQFNKVQTEYALERTRLKDKFPKVTDLKAKRDRLLSLLEARARRVLGNKATRKTTPEDAAGPGPSNQIFQGIQQDLANQLLTAQTNLVTQQVQMEGVRKAQGDLTRVFEQIPNLQLTYAELQRQVGVDSESVNFLLKKLEELKVLEAQESSPWRILNPAYFPGSPSSNTSRNWFVGAIAAVLLGVGLAVLLERLDDRVKTLEEAREITRLPLLGAIPEEKEQPLLNRSLQEELTPEGTAASTLRFNRSAFMESLRSLAFNLRYLGSDNSIKMILFTSPVPAEGKSTIVFNLARVLAERNFRVLVLDCDLRKPTLHRLTDLPNTQGLSTAIATGSPWQESVVKDHLPNLDLMTSGPLPPDPITLLDSARMNEILRECREAYDYVLLDTPPIVGIPDAQSIVSRVDASVLVLGVGISKRSLVARAMELLQAARASASGLVVNFLDEGSGRYFYQHYYSYYGESLPGEDVDKVLASRANRASRNSGRSLLGSLFRRS
ncbi:GumC family protein [Anthocerotibacter panamensis]|uniref:GumC family protein n=1 Tax=Anthocerotibacter panamensis TaxID=2857077 RepID=UPI001C40201E|nr:polysaccharide biosynthesis tyrosine autokinase [Anthocerotibacter panamensis]